MLVRTATGILLIAAIASCGILADKDRVVIAEIDGNPITRGELNRHLRGLPAHQRPDIRTKGDMLRVLNQYIDSQLKQTVAAQMASDERLNIPREEIEELYDRQFPEHSAIINLPNPQDYNLTPADQERARQDRDYGVDMLMAEQKAELALNLRMQEAFESGEIEITDEEFQEQYSQRLEELHTPEQMYFRGAAFPTEMENASAHAAALYRRVTEQGEDFVDAVEEAINSRRAIPVISAIENTGTSDRIQVFWQHAGGSEVGDIIGPFFMPSVQMLVPHGEGNSQPMQIPSSYMVIEVLEYTPERTLTMDEARPMLAYPIMYMKMMRKLREENNVIVYEDKVEDPAMLEGAQERLF